MSASGPQRLTGGTCSLHRLPNYLTPRLPCPPTPPLAAHFSFRRKLFFLFFLSQQTTHSTFSDLVSPLSLTRVVLPRPLTSSVLPLSRQGRHRQTLQFIAVAAVACDETLVKPWPCHESRSRGSMLFFASHWLSPDTKLTISLLETSVLTLQREVRFPRALIPAFITEHYSVPCFVSHPKSYLGIDTVIPSPCDVIARTTFYVDRHQLSHITRRWCFRSWHRITI